MNANALSQSNPQMYAGFWCRFLASVIDCVVVGFPGFFISLLAWRVFSGPTSATQDQSSLEFIRLIVGGVFFVVFLGQWLYFALMESSSKQGTIGKLILKIRVTDLASNRISFGRASLRYFSKYISYIIFFIGYLMAGFTQRKQALHDIVAETLVLRNF